MKTNIIYNEDCIKGMNKFPDDSIDLILTSPPFKEEDVDGDYWDVYDAFFQEAMRVCSKAAIIIHSSTKLNYLISKYPPKRVMIWGKMVSKYSYRFNPMLVYQKSDEYKVNKRIWTDCIGVPSMFGNGKTHKYQDPKELYKLILSMFKDCQIVLDPFMGSGTTAIACKELGRDYIGFEIDSECYEVIESNLSQKMLTEFLDNS